MLFHNLGICDLVTIVRVSVTPQRVKSGLTPLDALPVLAERVEGVLVSEA